MRLTHTTLLSNLPSIRERGILAAYSKQGRKASWYHQRRQDAWAENHVRFRHGAPADDLVHLEVEIPDSWVSRHASGIFYCFRDVPFSRVRSIRVVRRVVESVSL